MSQQKKFLVLITFSSNKGSGEPVQIANFQEPSLLNEYIKYECT